MVKIETRLIQIQHHFANVDTRGRLISSTHKKREIRGNAESQRGKHLKGVSC